MAYPNFTAASVMDRAAALNNDPALTIYPYPKQLPFLNQSLQELQEFFELNNVPVTDTFTSDPITVPIGVDHIAFPPDMPVTGVPYLPADMVEPKVVWQRQANVNPYIRMTRVDYLPRYWEGEIINYWLEFTWQDNEIRFFAANQINQVKLDYIRNLFPTVTDSDTEIGIVNGQSFLQYRTGGLIAAFLGENPARAQELDQYASLAMDRVVGIGTKGRQAIQTRRRPFRSGYKQASYS